LAGVGAFARGISRPGSNELLVGHQRSSAAVGLQTGAFTNSLTANYKSGYHDEQFPTASSSPVYAASDTGYTTRPFATFDGQSKYQATKAVAVTVGIKNLFDRMPPLSLQPSGGGNYSGYDGRYYDIPGRTYYVSGNYKF
jgi:iron complex outermembrane receptor protein